MAHSGNAWNRLFRSWDDEKRFNAMVQPDDFEGSNGVTMQTRLITGTEHVLHAFEALNGWTVGESGTVEYTRCKIKEYAREHEFTHIQWHDAPKIADSLDDYLDYL